MSHDGNSEEFRGDTENRITSAKDEQLNQKILARKERNRASALKSRLRKQEHVESLKNSIREAAGRKSTIEARVKRLRDRTAQLQAQVELAEGHIPSQDEAAASEIDFAQDYEPADMDLMLLLDRSPTDLLAEQHPSAFANVGSLSSPLDATNVGSLLAENVDSVHQLTPSALNTDHLDWAMESVETPLVQDTTTTSIR